MIGDIPQELSSTSENKNTKNSFFHIVALMLLIVALGPVMWFNHSLFLIINGAHTPATDEVWLALTTLGDGLLLSIFLGAFLLVNPRITFFGILLLLMSSGLVHLIKICFPALRPVALLDGVHVAGPVLKSGAFPSGHAAAAMSVGLTIVKFYQSRFVSVAAIMIAGMIGLSRIFVGAHFPADVLGGIICCTLSFIVMEKFLWPGIEYRILTTPSFRDSFFRRTFYLEVVAVLYAVSVYSCFFAELPWVGSFVSLSVLFFLTAGYRRLSAHR